LAHPAPWPSPAYQTAIRGKTTHPFRRHAVAGSRSIANLECGGRRRSETARWPSENPQDVSTGGGKAVTVKVSVCYCQPAREQPRRRDDPATRPRSAIGGAQWRSCRVEGTRLAKRENPPASRAALKTASPDGKAKATCELRGQTRSVGPTQRQKRWPSPR